MKKLITLLFVVMVAVMLSCTSKPAETAASTDTTKVVADTTIVVDSTAIVQ